MNQKLATPQNLAPRQGNANFVLYKLATQAAQAGTSCDSSDPGTISNTSCVFYDVTKGNISVPCAANSPDCSGPSGGILVSPPGSSLPAWTAQRGYDMATGLGSVNALNLVNSWSSAAAVRSTTALTSLSPTVITHGQPVNVTVTVSSSSGMGTPTGKVTLIGGPGGRSLGIDGAVLVANQPPSAAATATFTTNLLPGSLGASYPVIAHYDGDGTFGASDSSPVTVSVSVEGSKTQLDFVTFGQGGPIHHTTSAVAAFGSPYILRATVSKADPAISSCFPNPLGELGCPTGLVQLTDNGQPFDGSFFAVNSLGFSEDQPIQLLAGSHQLAGKYSGDSSFSKSDSPAVSVTITPTPTTATLLANPSPVVVNTPFTLTAVVDTLSNAVDIPPTGAVQFFKNGTPFATGTLIPTNRPRGSAAQSTASVSTAFPQQGTQSFTAQYAGDNNYTGSAATAINLTVTPPDFILSAQPTTSTVAASASAAYTITITPRGGFSSPVSLSSCVVTTQVSVQPQFLPVCTASPASITPSANPVTSILTVTTSARAWFPPVTPTPGRWRLTPLPLAALLLLGLIAWANFARLRVRAFASAALAVLGLLRLFGVSGCGGGEGSHPMPLPIGTTAGQYTVTATWTSGSLTQTIAVTLNVN